MSLLLYLLTTSLLLAVWRRTIQTFSLAAAVALVLLPLCFTGSAILRGRVFAPIDLPYASEPLRDYAEQYGATQLHNGAISDLYMQMIPWQSAVRQALSRGELPLWNPYMLAGTILAANMQSAPYDAVQIIGLLLDHPDALTFGATMTFFLAAFFTFAFARSLGCGEAAAVLGATGSALCGMLAFFVGWPLGRVWTFLPMVFLGVRLVVRETSLRAAIVLTAAFVLTIFSGHPESVLHIVSCGAAWGVFELWSARGRRWRAAGQATLCGVIALLLTAIALLPFLSVAPETSDFALRRDVYAQADWVSSTEAVLRRAAGSLFPFYGGRGQASAWTPLWEPTTLRVGSVVLALAILAGGLARRRETLFFGALTVVAGLAGLNAWPVAHVLHELPLFNIAINERLVFAGAFGLSILAALAADAWPSSRRAGFLAAAVVLLIAAGLALGSAAIMESQAAAGVQPAMISKILGVELVPLLLMALLLAARTPRPVALSLLLGCLLIQRTIEDGGTYPALERRMFYPEVPVLRHIRADTRVPFRIVPMHFALMPDTAALYGLEDVRGYEAMTFKRLTETYPLWSVHQPLSFNVVADKSRPFLSFLNVRYAIGSANEQPDAQWKLVREDRNSRVFENTRVLPRAFVPGRVEYVPAGETRMESMQNTTDFGSIAWITAPELPPHTIDNGPGRAQIVRTRGGEHLLDVQMDKDGWLVTSEVAWPGWRAYIDGRRVETRFANHAFVGVFVPAGHHQVRLRYLPEAFTRGRNISLTTFVLLAAWLAGRSIRRRRFQNPGGVGL